VLDLEATSLKNWLEQEDQETRKTRLKVFFLLCQK